MDTSDGAAEAVAPQQRFEIKVTLTEQDFAQLMRQVRVLPVERAMSIMPCALLGVVAAFVGFLGWEWLAQHYPGLRVPGGDTLAVAILIGAFLLLWLKAIVPLYIRGVFRGQPIGMGEVHLVADENDIATDTAGILTRVPWTLINRIVETDQRVFLMYGRLTGIIVPKSAFASTDEAARFSTFARSQAVAAH
jgi:hypothetical protein